MRGNPGGIRPRCSTQKKTEAPYTSAKQMEGKTAREGEYERKKATETSLARQKTGGLSYKKNGTTENNIEWRVEDMRLWVHTLRKFLLHR